MATGSNANNFRIERLLMATGGEKNSGAATNTTLPTAPQQQQMPMNLIPSNALVAGPNALVPMAFPQWMPVWSVLPQQQQKSAFTVVQQPDVPWIGMPSAVWSPIMGIAGAGEQQHVVDAVTPTAAQQVTPLLAIPLERQPSTSPLSGSRISSPDTISAGRARKLKRYTAEEKTDIIDCAKCIGNRAAGREFNVAESSIRKWRKNEDKIRRQAETTAGCTQHFEKNRLDILADIDNQLVQILNAKEKPCSWYGISEQATKLWAGAAKKAKLDAGEMKITMGWVARFMRRNEQRVPSLPTPLETRSKTRNKAKVSSNNSQQETTLKNGHKDIAVKESVAEKHLGSGFPNENGSVQCGWTMQL